MTSTDIKVVAEGLDILESDTENNTEILFSKRSSIELQAILLNPENKINLPLINMDKLNREYDREKFGPTWKRFLVMFLASIAYCLQIFSLNIWNPIYEPALLAFPNWRSRSFSMLSVWPNVMTVFLVFPVCLTINKYGLKLSLLRSCFLLTFGSAVRCLPSVYSSTLHIHISAMCLAAGGVFMTPLMITISAQWFPKNERNFATCFGSTVGMLGSAATYIIGPMILYTDSEGPLNPTTLRIRIMHMLYACFGLNVFITILVYLIFPFHAQPVSYISKQTIAFHQTAKFYDSLKTMFINLDMWCLVLAFALFNTMSSPWTSLLPSTFSKLHVPHELSATMGLFLIIHTFCLSLSMSAIADWNPGYNKEFVLCSRFISSIFLLWLMLMLNFSVKMTTTTLVCVVLMAFPYGWCTTGLLYEMGIKLMYTLPENFVVGYMTLWNNLFVNLTYLVLLFFPNFDRYGLHICVFIFSVLSIIYLCLTKDETAKELPMDTNTSTNKKPVT